MWFWKRKPKETYEEKYHWEYWGEINSSDTSHPYFLERPVKTRRRLIMKWYDFIPYDIRADLQTGGFEVYSRQFEFLINGRSIPARNTFDLNNVGDDAELSRYFFGI